MEWMDFVSFISIPLIAVVGFAIKMAMNANKALAEFKTEVAKEYASIKYLKDVETRIFARFDRIEDKLDRYANGRGKKE